MKSNRPVITMDGPAGSGKSTLSAMLAQKLGWVNLNSGALYRAIAYEALQKKIRLDDHPAITTLAQSTKLELRENAQKQSEVLINGRVAGDEIRTPEVSEATSKIAVIPEVRAALRDAQRHAFAGRGLVAEGRDMGTVVFADANLKIFLTVSEDARIERRIAQLKSEAEKAGAAMTDEAIASLRAQMRVEIQERDIRDSSRAVAPLKPAADAITVDNSSKTLEETLEEILKLARARGL